MIETSLTSDEMIEAYKLGVKRDYGIDLPDTYIREILGKLDEITTQRRIYSKMNRDVWRLFKRAYDNGLTKTDELESVEKFLVEYPHSYWEEDK